MTAATYYRPAVFLDGVRLGESAPTDGLAAVAAFTISWGARDWYENVEPAVLSLTVLDPRGELLDTATESLIEIKRREENVDHPSSLIRVFAGYIDEIESTWTQRTDPRTGDLRDMWVHQIKASDPLALLRRDRALGPPSPLAEYKNKDAHWGPCTVAQRRKMLDDRSSWPIIWPDPALDGNLPGGDVHTVSFYESSQKVSALTVLRNTLRLTPGLPRPYFHPVYGIIKPVQPDISLLEVFDTRAGGVESLYGWTVPAGAFSMPDGLTVSTSAREMVNRVELNLSLPLQSGTIVERHERTYSYALPEARDVQLTASFDSDINASIFDLYPQLRNAIEQGYRSALRAFFGAPRLNPLVYRFKKHEPAPAWAINFLTPHPGAAVQSQPVTYWLKHSPAAWLRDMRPFAVVGGELSYSNARGWEAMLYPAALKGPNPNERPKLSSLTSRLELGDVEPGVLVADYQHITKTKNWS